MIETLMKMPIDDAMYEIGFAYYTSTEGEFEKRHPWFHQGSNIEITHEDLAELGDIERRMLFTYIQNENEKDLTPKISQALVTIKTDGIGKSEYQALKDWEMLERSKSTDSCRLDGISIGGDGSGNGATITFYGYLKHIGEKLIEMG